jgi:pimeloyl-ACP methyl ester carboxylesterase
VSCATSPRRITLREAEYRLRWEAEQGTLDLGRYHPSYVRWGRGQPLIFIHGLGDTWPSFVMPMALLAPEFTCIGYNQPRGQGDRAWLRGYRHDHLVDDLIQLLDRFHLKSATLVAHSFGTTVALKALHRCPERFQRAVVVGSFAHRPLRPQERALAWLGQYLPGRLEILPGRVKAMQRSHGQAFAEREPAVLAHFLRRTALPLCRAMAHWAFELDRTDLNPILPAIHRPVLVVGGEWDSLTPPRLQKHLFQSLPQSALFLIDRCGHFPMYTHPEALADAIRRFVASPPCATPAASHLCLGEANGSTKTANRLVQIG